MLALLSATVFMLTLPVASLVLRNVGPAARVTFYEYLPLEELGIVVLAAVVGALVGADVPRWFRARATREPLRLHRVGLVGLVLLCLSVAVPHVRAFPASAGVAERDAWARGRVRHYAALTRIIAAIPEVQADLGHITAMAPTSGDPHVFAREMNGDDMRFTIDVHGDRGHGTFHAVCTLDDFIVYEWQSGRWSFRGHERRIDRVPNRVPE